MDFKLRKLIESDFEDFISIFNTPVSLKYNLRYSYPVEQNSFREQWWKLLFETLTRYYFAIEINFKYAGNVSIKNITEHSAELGYNLSEKYFDKGLMTKIVSEVLVKLKEDFGLNLVYADVMPENIASCRVLEKNGFTYVCDKMHYSKRFEREVSMRYYEKHLD